MATWRFRDDAELFVSFLGFLWSMSVLLGWAFWQEVSEWVLRRLGFVELADRRLEHADEAFRALMPPPEEY